MQAHLDKTSPVIPGAEQSSVWGLAYKEQTDPARKQTPAWPGLRREEVIVKREQSSTCDCPEKSGEGIRCSPVSSLSQDCTLTPY